MNTNSTNIRRALPQDAPRLTQIAFAAKRHWQYPEQWIQQWVDDLTITEEYINKWPVFVAELSGSICGFCALTQGNNDWELDHMWIDPDFIGQGLGGALHAQVIGEARSLKIDRLTTLSDPQAQGFYQKMGWRLIADIPSSIPGRTLPQMTFEID